MASLAVTRPDFSQIPPEAIKELHRQSEICLQGTLQLALAVDQRAITLTGILGAGSIALAAARVTMLSSVHPNPAMVGAAAITALVLFSAALLCAWAARPSSFHVAGYEPKRMAKAALNDIWILRYATEDAQVRIDSNRRSLERASRNLAWGMCVAMIALPVGASVFSLYRSRPIFIFPKWDAWVRARRLFTGPGWLSRRLGRLIRLVIHGVAS